MRMGWSPSLGQKCPPSLAGWEMQWDPQIQAQGGHFRVRAAPRSQRGPARAGSAASLPVARTTGCDGAISIRAIAGTGRCWGVGGAISQQVWGAGEDPPQAGVHMSPLENPPQEPPPPCHVQPSRPHRDRDMAPWHRALWGDGESRMEQGPHEDRPQIPEEETRHSPATPLPHPDACAPPQTQGRARGGQGDRGVPCTPPPRAEGLATPRGSGAATKVQLRFFAFGTMATFPTWLNYSAGCCLCGGGWGGLFARCSPEPGLQDGSRWQPMGSHQSWRVLARP